MVHPFRFKLSATETAFLLLCVLTGHLGSTELRAQSPPSNVVHLLCTGNYFSTGQGRIDIDLQSRSMAGQQEGTTTNAAGATTTNTMTVTEAAYRMDQKMTANRPAGFYFTWSMTIDRVTGHIIVNHWGSTNENMVTETADCKVITGTPAF